MCIRDSPVHIIGMHLCGNLSMIAIELFYRMELAHKLVLCPCCLPRQNAPGTPVVVYTDTCQLSQYHRWVHHLGSYLSETWVETRTTFDENLLSERSAIISSTKLEQRPHPQVPHSVAAVLGLIGEPCWALTMKLSHAVSYTHLRAHETPEHLVCRLLLEKKKKNKQRTEWRKTAKRKIRNMG
eukprot:TRINITY_DN10799_c0_g1_i1.p1 TRINITY_DN10799_c0_g1~~TRINITY_DN10799_c0_g1_i1.p1  ORF type:complete len:183 (-),score=45.24 TRINITY_DN10799_c0_g1_i1:72-620(-)